MQRLDVPHPTSPETLHSSSSDSTPPSGLSPAWSPLPLHFFSTPSFSLYLSVSFCRAVCVCVCASLSVSFYRDLCVYVCVCVRMCASLTACISTCSNVCVY